MCVYSYLVLQGPAGDRGFNGANGAPGRPGDTGLPGSPGTRGLAGSKVCVIWNGILHFDSLTQWMFVE